MSAGREVPEQDADLETIGHVCDKQRAADLAPFLAPRPLRLVPGVPLGQALAVEVVAFHAAPRWPIYASKCATECVGAARVVVNPTALAMVVTVPAGTSAAHLSDLRKRLEANKPVEWTLTVATAP